MIHNKDTHMDSILKIKVDEQYVENLKKKCER
jgi:hypothetical protein